MVFWLIVRLGGIGVCVGMILKILDRGEEF